MCCARSILGVFMPVLRLNSMTGMMWDHGNGMPHLHGIVRVMCAFACMYKATCSNKCLTNDVCCMRACMRTRGYVYVYVMRSL